MDDEMGYLCVAQSPSESDGLLDEEGVFGWCLVQSWVFSVVKTPSSHHCP